MAAAGRVPSARGSLKFLRTVAMAGARHLAPPLVPAWRTPRLGTIYRSGVPGFADQVDSNTQVAGPQFARPNTAW